MYAPKSPMPQPISNTIFTDFGILFSRFAEKEFR